MSLGDRFIEKTVNGQPIRFGKLNVYDWREVASAERAKLRERVKSSLEQLKTLGHEATKEEVAAELDRVENLDDDKLVIHFAFSADGVVWTLERALKHAGVADPSAVVANLPAGASETGELVSDLWSFPKAPPQEKPAAEPSYENGAGVANPTEPEPFPTYR